MIPWSRSFLRALVLALAASSLAGCQGCDKSQPPATRLGAGVTAPVAVVASPSLCDVVRSWS